MYRSRPVRKAVSQGNITIVNGKAKFGRTASSASAVSVLSQAGDIHGRRDRDRERYHNPNVTPDELTRKDHPFRLTGA